ncbi:MAG: hypothetical protein AAGI23_01540 [Bacteroidota bacterium]
MQYKNTLWYGLVVGVILPLVGFTLLYFIFQYLDRAGAVSNVGLGEDFRIRTTGIIAIALNAIALNRFYNQRATQTMRGIVIATFVYVVAWIIFFGSSVL